MPANSSSPDAPGTAPTTAATPHDNRSARFVGYGLFVLIVLLVVGIFLLSGASDVKGTMIPLEFFGMTLNEDQVLFLAVMAAGALGGCIHVATSFSDYVGNGQYRASWQWWYLMRPLIGGCLAAAFYFLIRGGVMSLAGGGSAQPTLHGMVAMSFLVGMFSKQATDKLDDVFDTLFNSDKDSARGDGLDTSAPVVNAVVPDSVDAGSGDTRVVLAGAHFAAGSQVRVNGTDRAADSVKPNSIAVTLTAAELATPTETPLKLAVATPGGVVSNVVELVVAERRQTPGAPDDRGTTGAGTQQPADQGAGQATVDISNASIVTPGEAGAGQGAGEGEAAGGEQELVPVASEATMPAEGEQAPSGENDETAAG